jgi:hypothetical protein
MPIQPDTYDPERLRHKASWELVQLRDHVDRRISGIIAELEDMLTVVAELNEATTLIDLEMMRRQSPPASDCAPPPLCEASLVEHAP